jgi:two-component system sensor histidine kinase HydH
MNLLKQTALILGVVALTVTVWTLYKNWRQKIAILFATLCFFIAVWALSFVAYDLLGGRLPRDVHWFVNLWLAPLGVTILSEFLSVPDQFSRALKWLSSMGATILSFMVAFSLGNGSVFWGVVSFWTGFIMIEYIYVMVRDLVFRTPSGIEFISPYKRKWLYAGLGVSLIICSLDHIPQFGYVIPSVGNLLFASYLAFAAQTVTPQKLLGVEALLSRFFAISTISLMITGFFALIYRYVSSSFPIFLLNSFLISFAVLMLWAPLVTFFRHVGKGIFRSENSVRSEQLGQFKVLLAQVTDLAALEALVQNFFRQWMKGETRLVFDARSLKIPRRVSQFFLKYYHENETPILHRALITMERDQVITSERKHELTVLLRFLNVRKCDIIFPIFNRRREAVSEQLEKPCENSIIALLMVTGQTSLDEWRVSLGFYSLLFEAVQDIHGTLARLTRIEEAKERDRLLLMGEMAAGLAHEVRNPLGAIRGAAALVVQAANEESAPWAKVIEEEVARLNRLVSQFLDFAHSPKDQPEAFDLNLVVQTSLQHWRNSIPSGIELKTKLLPQSVFVLAVPDHVQQVLINLVQNAVKAVEWQKNSKIEVEITPQGFLVRDNGIGMSQEIIDKIFQPFFTTFKDGTGLGLSICKRLIHFNGGEIKVSSKLGEGSEVRVELVNAR